MLIFEIFCNFAMDFTLLGLLFNGAQSTEWSSKTADEAQNQLMELKVIC